MSRAGLRSALSETLGSLHNIEARAHMIVRWIDDPNLHPVEEAEAIRRFRAEAHKRIVAALEEDKP